VTEDVTTLSPVVGAQYQHIATGAVARFVKWRERFGGGWLLVLDHPTYGECRWAPERVRPYFPKPPVPEPPAPKRPPVRSATPRSSTT
jgi:hypothetical protein